MIVADNMRRAHLACRATLSDPRVTEAGRAALHRLSRVRHTVQKNGVRSAAGRRQARSGQTRQTPTAPSASPALHAAGPPCGSSASRDPVDIRDKSELGGNRDTPANDVTPAILGNGDNSARDDNRDNADSRDRYAPRDIADVRNFRDTNANSAAQAHRTNDDIAG